jgi:hypothetical protein
MTALSVQPPFPILTDIDGQPLDDGFIFIGVVNLAPITNPITVYWDAALTVTATQPIRTRGGYPMNAGVPGRLYVNTDYSIQVQNRNGSVVYTSLDNNGPLGGGSISSVDVTFLQAGANAVERTAQSKMRDTVSVKDFGAVGDGVANDTAAIQNAVNSGNTNILVPKGTYLLSSLVTITSTVTLYGEGTFKEPVLREATILVSSADNVCFDGLTFEGPETLAAWNAGGAVYRQAYKAFVKFQNCDGGIVKNTRSSGKRGTVWADACNRMQIENNFTEGFFGPVSGASPADANWSTAYFLQGGIQHQLTTNSANENGSVVLLGNDTSYNIVMNTSGQDNHDNGIYNSSGDFSSFIGGVFDNPTGSGLKIRGRGHTVSGNTVRNTKTLAAGIFLTGNGVVPDAYNANGYGTVCVGNTLQDVAGIGIGMEGQDGYYARDFIISNNTIENHTPGLASEAAILVTATRGAKITDNIIRGSTATYAIGLFGAGGGTAPYINRAINCDISGNTISNSVRAIRVQNVDESIFNNNIGGDITDTSASFDLRLCDNNMVSGNYIEGGNIRLSSALGEECFNNVATNNRISSDYGGADKTQNITALPIDYQTGPWTAAYKTTGTDFGAVTYLHRQGYFTKIGRLVTVSGRLETTAITVGAASGDVVISDLPFQISDLGTGTNGAGSVNAIGFAGDVPIGLQSLRNETVLRLQYRTAVNGDDLPLAVADMNTGAGNRIFFTCTYTTDD